MFEASNDEVKYKLFMSRIELYYPCEANLVKAYILSQLGVRQLKAKCEASEENMLAYFKKLKQLPIP